MTFFEEANVRDQIKDAASQVSSIDFKGLLNSLVEGIKKIIAVFQNFLLLFKKGFEITKDDTTNMPWLQ